MTDFNNKIELKGKSGNVHTFVRCYHLTKNEQPRSGGIFVFTKKNSSGSGAILDVQLLIKEDEIKATLQRMKEDGAHTLSLKNVIMSLPAMQKLMI